MNRDELYSNRLLRERELVQRRDRHIETVNVRVCCRALPAHLERGGV